MQMKFKKTGAALLVATMTVTGASYAWANENLFDTVDLNKVKEKKERAIKDLSETENIPVDVLARYLAEYDYLQKHKPDGCNPEYYPLGKNKLPPFYP